MGAVRLLLLVLRPGLYVLIHSESDEKAGVPNVMLDMFPGSVCDPALLAELSASEPGPRPCGRLHPLCGRALEVSLLSPSLGPGPQDSEAIFGGIPSISHPGADLGIELLLSYSHDVLATCQADHCIDVCLLEVGVEHTWD